MYKLPLFYIFILIILAFSVVLHLQNVMAQSTEWSNYTNYNLGITFDYPSSWNVTEKTNRFEQGPDVSVGSGLHTYTYAAPTMNIQYFDSYVAGLSIGLNLGIPYSNLQIVENYKLNELQIDGQPTATALYAYNLATGERIAEQEYLVYKDYQAHSLKFRDSASDFDSSESQATRDHMTNSFHFVESPFSISIKELDRNIASSPDDINVLFDKANLLAAMGDFPAALQYDDKVLNIEPNNTEALEHKAVNLERTGKHKEAIEFANRVLAVNATNIRVLEVKALALDSIGDHNASLANYDNILRIDPSSSFALNNKGIALVNLYNNTGALYYFDKALEINSSDQTAMRNKEIITDVIRNSTK